MHWQDDWPLAVAFGAAVVTLLAIMGGGAWMATTCHEEVVPVQIANSISCDRGATVRVTDGLIICECPKAVPRE